jgi:hypothetical protein
MVEWIGAIASGIGCLVSAAWYSKSKNRGHLFMAVAFLVAAAGLGYLAIY